MDIKEKISLFPDSAGVYLMKDSSGKIIYIGKAKSLRKRLNSYLGRELSAKTVSLMSSVSDIEFRTCPSESMALILEAGLIHKHQPKYNTVRRDDKSFPWIRITAEKFPLICITRKKDIPGHYLGPYTNAGLLKEALSIIRRNFPYRSCSSLPGTPCVYYRIKLCPAPCIENISKNKYAGTIKQISLILEGKEELLLKGLKLRMHREAQERNFEQAAVLRDKIIALSSLRPESHRQEDALLQLKSILKLKNLPLRIEAFDVSHILGRQATASMVSFYDGLADKDDYRRFKIKTIHEADDCAMLAEAVARRYRRLKEENSPLPDLILVDGGRGQWTSANKELRLLGLDIPLISLAKKEEEVYDRFSLKPLRLNRNSSALRLIQCIRDEAHRFALKYHHILRKRRAFGENKNKDQNYPDQAGIPTFRREKI